MALDEIVLGVVACAIGNLNGNLVNPGIDCRLRTSPFDDRCQILSGNHLASRTDHIGANRIKAHAGVFGNDFCAYQSSNIVEDILITWRLDGQCIKGTLEAIKHKQAKRFAIHIVSNQNEVFLTTLSNHLKQRDKLLRRRNLLVGNNDSWLVVHRFHSLRVCRHVRADEAALNGKALNHFAL